MFKLCAHPRLVTVPSKGHNRDNTGTRKVHKVGIIPGNFLMVTTVEKGQDPKTEFVPMEYDDPPSDTPTATESDDSGGEEEYGETTTNPLLRRQATGYPRNTPAE